MLSAARGIIFMLQICCKRDDMSGLSALPPDTPFLNGTTPGSLPALLTMPARHKTSLFPRLPDAPQPSPHSGYFLASSDIVRAGILFPFIFSWQKGHSKCLLRRRSLLRPPSSLLSASHQQRRKRLSRSAMSRLWTPRRRSRGGIIRVPTLSSLYLRLSRSW